MIYKINPTPSDNPDTVLLSGTTLVVNSVDYDLNNLDTDGSKPVYKVGTIYETDDNGNPTDEVIQEETTIINIKTPKNRMFMFIHMYGTSNLKRFFDIDSDGVISIEELETVVDYITEKDDIVLKTSLKTIRDAYLENHKIEEWNKKGA